MPSSISIEKNVYIFPSLNWMLHQSLRGNFYFPVWERPGGFVPLKNPKSRCVRSVLSFSFRRGQSSGKRELMVFPPFSFSASTSDYKTFSFFFYSFRIWGEPIICMADDDRRLKTTSSSITVILPPPATISFSPRKFEKNKSMTTIFILILFAFIRRNDRSDYHDERNQ